LPDADQWQIHFAALSLSGILLLYFQSHFPLEFAGIITEAFQTKADISLYLIYWIVQLWGVVYLVKKISLQDATYQDQQKTVVLCALLVQVISFFYIGKFNDWLMRTIISAQLIFFITLLNIWAKYTRTWAWFLLSAWLFVGFIYPCRSLFYSLFEQKDTVKITRSIPNAPTNYNEGNLAHIDIDNRFAYTDFSLQYLGKNDSFFYKYLCRQDPKTTKTPTQIAE
jgi:hypothetical protein